MQVRGPSKYIADVDIIEDVDYRRIDAEVEHPEFGWIPMTLSRLEYPEEYDAAAATDPEAYSAPSSEEELDAHRVSVQTRIDLGIGEVRQQFITEIPGQQMIYQAKEQEAIAYAAAVAALLPGETLDLTPFPYIVAEAAALGVSEQTVADTYNEMAADWRAIGVTLEALRIGGKAAVQAATDIAGVDAAYAAFETSLAAAVAAF